MDDVTYLKEQIAIGYKLIDLEKLIGMSKNTISGIVKSKRQLSGRDRLKIDVWRENKNKPHPLKVEEYLDKGEILWDKVELVPNVDMQKKVSVIGKHKGNIIKPNVITLGVELKPVSKFRDKLVGESSLEYALLKNNWKNG